MPEADDKKGIQKKPFELIAYLWKKPLVKFGVCVCFGIIVTTIPAIVYVHNFGKFGTSQQTDDWAKFGDYFGGVLNPVIALVNLFVVVYIATQLDNLRKKQTLVFNLHQEWNSQEMYSARTKAGRYVELRPNLKFREIEHSTDPEVVDLWIVLGFFQRLSALMKQDEINDKLAAELFLPLFAWWWVKCFENIPQDWDGWEPINYLNGWFERNAESKYTAWCKKYRGGKDGPSDQSHSDRSASSASSCPTSRYFAKLPKS
jgi:hypothetical protein